MKFDLDAFISWLEFRLSEFAARPSGTTTLDDRQILFVGLTEWPLPPGIGHKLGRAPTWLETISTAAVLAGRGVPLAKELEAWLDGHEAQFVASLGQPSGSTIAGPAATVIKANLAVTREHVELTEEERARLSLWRDEPRVTYVQRHPRGLTRIDVYTPDKAYPGTENFVGRLWRSKR